MNCYQIKARDLPDAWFQLVDLCYKEGREYTITEGSYIGQKRRELDYITIHIKYPQTKPLLPEIPPGLGIPDPVPEGMDYVERYLSYILTDHIEPGEQYTYGSRLFGKMPHEICHKSGYGYSSLTLSPISQVEEVINKFKRGFGNNQACMTIAKPEDIILSDPPCLRSIDCRIFPEEKKLHFYIYFRSWDIYGGFPANLAALTFLQEYMAQEIGVETGEFICASKGCHLYSMYWDLARIRLGEKE